MACGGLKVREEGRQEGRKVRELTFMKVREEGRQEGRKKILEVTSKT